MSKSMLGPALATGAAVVLEGVDILEPHINELCSEVEASLPCALVNCEAFFSQLGHEAYGGHCDSDDVLVVQIEGRKEWSIHAPQQRRYVNNAPLDESSMGPVLKILELHPGDALFVRAGVPHRCTTTGGQSLHLSFDLCDRSPNIEQITGRANQLHHMRLPPMYSEPSRVVSAYCELLNSREFLAEMMKLSLEIKHQAQAFRAEIAASHRVVLPRRT